MSTLFIKRLQEQAVRDKKWMNNAKWRLKNEAWLDISFNIAVKILQSLRERSMTQKDLAEILCLSPQYVSKIVKGHENLTLETICKIENALEICLIRVPDYVFTTTIKLSNTANNKVEFTSPVSIPPKSIELNETEESCCDSDLEAA